MITEIEEGKKVDKSELTELTFDEFTELLDQYESEYISHKFLLDKHTYMDTCSSKRYFHRVTKNPLLPFFSAAATSLASLGTRRCGCLI